MLEALVAGGGEGLVLVRDSAACEGRSLLRAFASAAVQRAERVLVLLFDVPREQFEVGLSPSVKQRLLYRDGFTDPLGWTGSDPHLRVGDFGGGLLLPEGEGQLPPGGPLTLVLDSLSWLLLRLPPPRLCQDLGALLGGAPKSARPSRVLALIHGDLHPPGLLRALGGLASTQLTLGGSTPLTPGTPPTPGTPQLISILSCPRRGGVRQKDEIFTLLPNGSLRCLGGPDPPPQSGSPQGLGVRDPPQPLTFRLQLSAAERAARAAVTPPYQLSPPRRSILLQTPGTIGCALEPPEDEDPEDPDDDLDV